eukprot:65152_1
MSLFDNKIERFAHIHPGGCYNLALAAHCNNDEAKMLFLSYHTGVNTDKVNQIAKLHKFNIPPLNKQTVLQAAIHKMFVNVQQKHAIHGVIYKIYAAIVCFTFIFSLIYNIFYSSFINNMLLMSSMVSYAFVVFHTRNHLGGNLFIKNNNLERKFFDIFDNIFAVPSKQWLYNHQLSHHLYPNSNIDYDIINAYPFLRLLNNNKICKKSILHKFQWIYGLILFMVNGLLFPLKNVMKNKNYAKNKINDINATDGHWIYLIFYILLFIVLPYYFNGIYALKLYLVNVAIGSFITAILFQISHHVTDIKHYNNDPTLKIKNYDTWIKTQIEEAMSWGGYIETLIFGGINFQIEHHVAPAILPIYYYFVSQQLQILCKKHKTQYTYFDNVFVAFYEYEKYVFNINK